MASKRTSDTLGSRGSIAVFSWVSSCTRTFRIFTGLQSDSLLNPPDLSMPIMGGLEACRRIREFERNYKLASTTIVALTGLASVETQRDAFASGMDMFYTKPVKLKDLSTAISEQKL